MGFPRRVYKWLVKLTPTRIALLFMLVFLVLYVQSKKGKIRTVELIEVKAYDARFQALYGLGKIGFLGDTFKTEASPDVVIADIDNRTLEHYDWPFPREKWALFMHRMQEYQPRVVGFDVVFESPGDWEGLQFVRDVTAKYSALGLTPVPENLKRGSTRGLADKMEAFEKYLRERAEEADQDKKFAAELAKMDNVVLGYFGYVSEAEVTDITPEDMERNADLIAASNLTVFLSEGAGWKDDVLGQLERKRARFYGIRPPIPVLAENNDHFGYFTANIDTIDGTLRYASIVATHSIDPENADGMNTYLYPSLSLETLSVWTGKDPQVKIARRPNGVRAVMLGDKLVPTDEFGRMLVNWLGPYGETFQHISMYDILTDFKDKPGVNPQDLFKDKIVLVGSSATGAHDLRTTPFGTAPGIEMHASAISNVLMDNVLITYGWFKMFDMLFILIVGILFGIVLPRVSAVWGGVVALAFFLGYLSFNIYLFLVPHLSFTIVFPLAEILVIYLGVTVYRYATEEREKRFIKKTFEHYLSPAVIDQLMKDPSRLALGGEKKFMTAFFSDIQSFSSFSEKMKPEELVHFLNIYLTEMCDILLEYDATIDKFEGDAIIAFFGAPIDLPDHAALASLASAEIQKRMVALREQWKEEGWPEVHMRIGLNTGDMVVGNMGSRDRMDYTMMGDAVNLAARLEEAAKQYKIYTMISEYTREAAGDVIEVRELDSVQVVGKELPVRVFEVLGKKGEVGEKKIQVARTFEEGLEVYRKGDFETALKLFEAALDIDPEDGPSLKFVARCEEFIENHPGEDWDGVYRMTKK